MTRPTVDMDSPWLAPMCACSDCYDERQGAESAAAEVARKVKRAMIAALYWRAGDLRSAADDAITPTARTILLLMFEATERAARAMESAL